MKLVLGIIAVIVAGTLLSMLGFKSCVKSIYKSKGCEWANIDNVELHAEIDVPPIISSTCDYNDSLDKKTAFFKLKKEAIDSEEYAKLHNFNKLNSFNDLGLFSFHNLNTDTLALENLFVKKISEHSLSVFDAKNKWLWVRIDYKN